MAKLTNTEKTSLVILQMSGKSSFEKLSKNFSITDNELSKHKSKLLSQSITINELKKILDISLCPEFSTEIMASVMMVKPLDYWS